MVKTFALVVVLGLMASLQVHDSAAESVNQVLQWNRTLLVIVRTPGAQPATVHPTRSFAIMHAAMYDAVNAIDGAHTPYLVHFTDVSRSASQDAAAAVAAHEVLVTLYPPFQGQLDAQLLRVLAGIPEGADKAQGISIGQAVADRILALRSNDGANAQPIPFVFGNAPGDYQSTPPNFPRQPQFTHWSRVTPFALERADQFRPGSPPVLTSDTYSDAFNEVKALGIVNSTASSADAGDRDPGSRYGQQPGDAGRPELASRGDQHGSRPVLPRRARGYQRGRSRGADLRLRQG